MSHENQQNIHHNDLILFFVSKVYLLMSSETHNARLNEKWYIEYE